MSELIPREPAGLLYTTQKILLPRNTVYINSTLCNQANNDENPTCGGQECVSLKRPRHMFPLLEILRRLVGTSAETPPASLVACRTLITSATPNHDLPDVYQSTTTTTTTIHDYAGVSSRRKVNLLYFYCVLFITMISFTGFLTSSTSLTTPTVIQSRC